MSVDIRDHGGIYGGKGGKGNDGGNNDVDIEAIIASSLNKTKNVFGAADFDDIPSILKRKVKVLNLYKGKQPLKIGAPVYVKAELGVDTDDLPSNHPYHGVTNVGSRLDAGSYFVVERGNQSVVYYRDEKNDRDVEVRGINEGKINAVYLIKEYQVLIIGTHWYDVSNPTLAKSIPPPANPHGVNLNNYTPYYAVGYSERNQCRFFKILGDSDVLCVINKTSSGYTIEVLEGKKSDGNRVRFEDTAFLDHTTKAKWPTKISGGDVEIEKPELKNLVFVTSQGENSIYYFSVQKRTPAYDSTWATYSLIKYTLNKSGQLVYKGVINSVITGRPNVFSGDSISYSSFWISGSGDFNFNYSKYPSATLSGQLVLTEDGQEFYIRHPFSRGSKASSFSGDGSRKVDGEYLEPATSMVKSLEPYYQKDRWATSFRRAPFYLTRPKEDSKWRVTLKGFPAVLEGQKNPELIEEYYEGTDKIDYSGANSVIGVLLEYDSKFMTVFIL